MKIKSGLEITKVKIYHPKREEIDLSQFFQPRRRKRNLFLATTKVRKGKRSIF